MKTIKVAVEVTGQGQFLYLDGPFEVPEEVWEDGETLDYLIEQGDVELGFMEGASILDASDLAGMGKEAKEILEKM